MTDPPPSECQICGAAPLEKVLYPAAIHFKGSGFYSTDYGRGGRKKDGDKPDSSSPAKDKPADKAQPDSKKPASESS